MVQAECDQIASRTGGQIVVHPFENLLIDCARDVGASVIVRGLRAVADFEYEFQMVGMNRALDASVETVFLMADARRQAIASKLVKEIARLGGDEFAVLLDNAGPQELAGGALGATCYFIFSIFCTGVIAAVGSLSVGGEALFQPQRLEKALDKRVIQRRHRLTFNYTAAKCSTAHTRRTSRPA